jgi:hypothetical protein
LVASQFFFFSDKKNTLTLQIFVDLFSGFVIPLAKLNDDSFINLILDWRI